MSARADGRDFKRAAAALKGLGDKDVRKAVAKGFREVAKPVGQSMVRAGAGAMPKRGGFAAQVARSSVTVGTAIVGMNPRVDIRLRNRAGYSLRPLDRGQLRHPVFARAGRPRVWVRQSVPAGAFTREFEAQAPVVRRRVLGLLEQAVNDAARKVS